MQKPAVLGNVYHIDTAGWMPDRGHFTLLNLHTLETTPITRLALSRDWD